MFLQIVVMNSVKQLREESSGSFFFSEYLEELSSV